MRHASRTIAAAMAAITIIVAMEGTHPEKSGVFV
jgi:hypothetical protein